MIIDDIVTAIFHEDCKKLLELLKYSDVDLNKCASPRSSFKGSTPLQAAVVHNNLTILDIILKQSKINKDILNGKKESCLFLSLKSKSNKEIIKRLIEIGCDVNICNSDCSSPLHLAVINGDCEIAELLIKHGANINSQDNRCFTPLHTAVKSQNLEMVQLLTYYNADPTIKCVYLYTPFMSAIEVNFDEIALELIDYEIDFNNISSKGESTLNIALANVSTLSEEIINRGADVNFITREKLALLDYTLGSEDANLFKKIWFKMDKKVLLHCEIPFLKTYIESCCFTKNNEWIECLYELLSSDVALELIDAWFFTRITIYRGHFDTCFDSIMEAFLRREIDENDRVAIMYLFLSLNTPVYFENITDAFYYFGYNEELKSLLYSPEKLHEDEYPIHYYEVKISPFFTKLFTDFSLDINQALLEYMEEDFSEKRFITPSSIFEFVDFFSYAFKYCTPSKTAKDEYFCKLNKYFNENQRIYNWRKRRFEHPILEKDVITETAEIPSLLELSRNSARIYISHKVRVKNTCHYLTFLDELNLPIIIKDFIKCKRDLRLEHILFKRSAEYNTLYLEY